MHLESEDNLQELVLLPSCMSQELNLGLQTWWQVLPTGPFLPKSVKSNGLEGFCAGG